MRDDFAVFIITHGRPDKQLTYNTLQKCGYTGKLYFVIDNTDNTIQEYIDNYGTDNIIVFDKNHYINSDEFDNGTNEGIYACAIYARRAVEDIAKALGLTYFCMFDDDILNFTIRVPLNGSLKGVKILNMDYIFDAYLCLLENANICCLGFGYAILYYSTRYFFEDKRPLPFQGFIRKVSVPIKWNCWYGEDELAGYFSNSLGKLWTVVPFVMTTIAPEASGAMANTYKTYNSYIRSFAELRYKPNDLIIAKCSRGVYKGEFRLHKKNYYWFPKILSDKYRTEK